MFQITLSGHDNYIHSLALKNGNTCASAAEDGTVRIWGNYDLSIFLLIFPHDIHCIFIISNLDIFSLISSSDIVDINELILILKIIGQCGIQHIMKSFFVKI